MPTLTEEGLAGIRLLVCMAKADGVLKADERYSLEDVLAGLNLPDGLTIEKLLEEKNDAAALAKIVQSQEGRDYIYAGVYSLAWCDRELADAEKKLLDLLRAEWDIHSDEEKALSAALEASHTASPEWVPGAVNDPRLREIALYKLINRYCIITALTGAVPVPLVPDLMVIPMQMKLVYDIAGIFGQKTDKSTVQLMLETLGVGTGCRLAVSAISKFVPGWGSVVGATSAFATTYALGKVAWTYFEHEGKKPIESLKPVFQEQQKQGRQEYQKQKAALEEAQRAHAAELKQLAFELQQGKISQKEYEEKLDALS